MQCPTITSIAWPDALRRLEASVRVEEEIKKKDGKDKHPFEYMAEAR